MRSPVTFHQTGGPNHLYLSTYKEWLDSQSLTPNTVRVYHSRIKQFLRFLEYTKLSDKPLSDVAGINQAMGLYLEFLKQSKRTRGTVNANVNALKSFSQFLGLKEAQLKRERCYEKSTKVLTLSEQQRFLETVAQQESARDRAIALMLFYTGLRIGDCARLNMDNIGAGASCIALETGAIIPLNCETIAALRQCLEERKFLVAEGEKGLWLTKYGRRLKIAGITCIIERIAWQAKLVISAETLRRTLLIKSTDHHDQEELASMFGGYINKATIKRYRVSLSIEAAQR